MASIFSHTLVAVTLGKTYSVKKNSNKFLLLATFCSVIPDADVIMFKFGIAYQHVLGHRGFFHSLVFSLLLGLLVTAIFYRKDLFTRKGLHLIFFFFLCTGSHAVLDAMTTGGLGVAFFAPFENSRYFLPWRPILVSPLGVGNFFSEWGLQVLKSEFFWIGIPCFALLGLNHFLTKKTNQLE